MYIKRNVKILSKFKSAQKYDWNYFLQIFRQKYFLFRSNLNKVVIKLAILGGFIVSIFTYACNVPEKRNIKRVFHQVDY